MFHWTFMHYSAYSNVQVSNVVFSVGPLTYTNMSLVCDTSNKYRPHIV